MRNDRHLAIELRKKGASYNKISKELDIPKSTMCYWFRNLQWSKTIKEKLNERNIRMARKRMRIVSRANKSKWEKWRESYRQEAKREFKTLLKNPLFTAGLNLYWGEGDNKLENGVVRLANTDPRIIRIFSKFLRFIKGAPIDKIKISLVLYPDLSEEKCRDFWSQVAKIPKSQFFKTQFIKGRHPSKRLEYGICTIHISSRALKEKIATWKNLFYNEYKSLKMRE